MNEITTHAYYQGCAGKVRHRSAKIAWRWVHGFDEKRLHAYRCQFCSKQGRGIWHIGHRR